MSGGNPLVAAHWRTLAGHPPRSPLWKYLLATPARVGWRGRLRRHPCHSHRRTRRIGEAGLGRVACRRDIHSRKNGGADVGKTKVGKGMKLEVVVDASGLPLGLAIAAADVSEQELLKPALDDVPVEVPPNTPVIADKGHDSDALRDELQEAGYTPVIPHRKNRVKPSRNDGRRLRRYGHRWLMERTNAWLHCYRGVAVRWSYYTFMYEGLVYLSFIHMALQRF